MDNKQDRIVTEGINASDASSVGVSLDRDLTIRLQNGTLLNEIAEGNAVQLHSIANEMIKAGLIADPVAIRQIKEVCSARNLGNIERILRFLLLDSIIQRFRGNGDKSAIADDESAHSQPNTPPPDYNSHQENTNYSSNDGTSILDLNLNNNKSLSDAYAEALQQYSDGLQAKKDQDKKEDEAEDEEERDKISALLNELRDYLESHPELLNVPLSIDLEPFPGSAFLSVWTGDEVLDELKEIGDEKSGFDLFAMEKDKS